MNSREIHHLIAANRSHPHFGRLLHHQDAHNRAVLHYSVQLNDYQSLGWEPIHGGEKGIGQIAIWQINWEIYRPAQWVHHLSPDLIAKYLHCSVDVFHLNWQYDLYRFNCEHWGRLVTTGDCRCFQIHEFKKLQQIPIIGFLIVAVAGFFTGAWEENGYARDAVKFTA